MQIFYSNNIKSAPVYFFVGLLFILVMSGCAGKTSSSLSENKTEPVKAKMVNSTQLKDISKNLKIEVISAYPNQHGLVRLHLKVVNKSSYAIKTANLKVYMNNEVLAKSQLLGLSKGQTRFVDLQTGYALDGGLSVDEIAYKIESAGI